MTEEELSAWFRGDEGRDADEAQIARSFARMESELERYGFERDEAIGIALELVNIIFANIM